MCHVNITWCSQWYSTSLFGNEDHIGLIVSLFCNLHISIHEKKIESKREREREKEGLTTSLSRIPSPLWKHLHFRLEAVNGTVVYWCVKKKKYWETPNNNCSDNHSKRKAGECFKKTCKTEIWIFMSLSCISQKILAPIQCCFIYFSPILFSVNKYLQKLSFLTKQSHIMLKIIISFFHSIQIHISAIVN